MMIFLSSCNKDEPVEPDGGEEVLYTFPAEHEHHEATWLQWPHHYQYGKKFRDALDPTWVELTRQLVKSEKVHIVAYDNDERQRIKDLLTAGDVDQSKVFFYVFPTDDFWVRDNGPIYVRDKSGALVIQDWGFNGWGRKAKYRNCDPIPVQVGQAQSIPVVDLNETMINEGGSVELDGHGTLMACKSSILNNNRNPGMTQKEAESIFRKYLGATHFVWLDGQPGLEITDQHIDGFARFGSDSTIVTMAAADLLEYDVLQSDIDKLFAAKDANGVSYSFVKLPLTQKTVSTSDGEDLGYKGSYVNYYIANSLVIVPTYSDPNDQIAISILQDLYPFREVVGIDFRNVYANGGMAHCVTQQQPAR